MHLWYDEPASLKAGFSFALSLSNDVEMKHDPELIHGDCRDILKDLGKSGIQADLIFVDPPFAIGQDYEGFVDLMSPEEYIEFTEEYLQSLIQVCHDHTSVWFNVPDSIAAEIVTWMRANDFHLINWCIWHYRFAQNHRARFLSSKTHALWFCQWKPKWYPDRVVVESCRSAEYDDWRDDATGFRVPFDVWGFERFWGRVQGNNKERRQGHPNQLPEKYLERVILCCTDEDDLVIDPFLVLERLVL